jgi:hypothetical protein
MNGRTMKMHWKAGLGAAAALVCVGAAMGQPYQINWYTVDGGGTQTATDGTLFLSSTIGQPDAGTLSDGTLILQGGYWHGGQLTCDDIDFNNDNAFFDPQDIDAFLSVFSEGPCVPVTATCSDTDFNNDGALFDPCDIDAFLLVFSEGPCTYCGTP